MQTWWGWVFQPRAPSVNIVNVVLQSGQIASLFLSAWGGAVTGAVFRGFWNVDTADSVEDGKVLRAISLPSTRATISFIGLVRMSFVPSTSRLMSESARPFSKTSRMALSV